MTDAAQLERLLNALRPVLDRQLEYVKASEGSRLLWLGMMPAELKEIRSAFEPFRVRSSSSRHPMVAEEQTETKS